uniref:Bloodthirsty-related gene family, member 30 n=1 Tax=Poecilia reticulata TaxID=8081 RepID=A0A3P9P8T8_POERE
MAEAPELFSEQELTCSICLDLFTDPVSTPCGHNFCQACIGGYWASSSVCTCPLCKRQFDERPQLSINKVFALIADKFKQTRYGATGFSAPVGNGALDAMEDGRSTNPFLSPLPAPAAPGDLVWCDVCSGVKQPAVSSCLTCTASYCSEHLQPHYNTAFYAKHLLLDPQEALRGRTCSTHRRLMEVYCKTCQRCICAICVLQDHRTHKTVSVQTERLGKQKLVARTEQEILNCIKEKEIRLSDLKRKLESVQNYADKERGDVEHLLDEVSASLDRIRTQVVGGIQNQLEAVTSKGEAMVHRLEAELSQLTDRRATLEVQAISQDHISFLQSFEEATAPLDEKKHDDADEEAELSLHFHLDDVKSSLSDLKIKVDEIWMGEIHPRASRGSRDSKDFPPGDLMAAESMMSLRGSKSTLRMSQWSLKDTKKSKHVTGLKKARAYMEDVTLNPVTAYPFLILSEDRKQLKRGEKLQFFRNSHHRFDVWSCVIAKEGFSSGRHYWEVKGHHPKLRQVGIFLDVEEGQVSFYNVKSGTEIYSFPTNTEFTERMFPLLGTGDKEVPLILATAQHHPA